MDDPLAPLGSTESTRGPARPRIGDRIWIWMVTAIVVGGALAMAIAELLHEPEPPWVVCPF